MSVEMAWRQCKHCAVDKYCSPQVMLEHEEDCPKRPSVRSKFKTCPVCSSVLAHGDFGGGVTWFCVNTECTFELQVHDGGKVT